MSSWWVSTPESERILAEERLVVCVAEQLNAHIEKFGLQKKALAKRLGIKPAELSQRLSGKRNLTLRSLAAVAHELGQEVEITFRPIGSKAAQPAYSTHRRSDWPADARYTNTGIALRGITGHGAA